MKVMTGDFTHFLVLHELKHHEVKEFEELDFIDSSVLTQFYHVSV